MNKITEISKEAVDRYFNALALFGYKDYTDVYKLLALLHIEELLTQQAYSGFVSEEDYRVIMDALYCLTGGTCLIPYPEFINNDSLIHETLRNYIPRVTQDSNLRYTEESNPRLSTDNIRFTAKTVSPSKDYPEVNGITKVSLIGGPVSDWREFNIPSSETNITITYESNRGTIELYTDGFIVVYCSVKIGSKWYNASGTELSTEAFFPLTEETETLRLPGGMGLSSKYTATITLIVPANPESYTRNGELYIGTDSLMYIQAGATIPVTIA